jgi:hypothetical protein
MKSIEFANCPSEKEMKAAGWQKVIDDPPPLDEEIDLAQPWHTVGRTTMRFFLNSLYWRHVTKGV